MVYIIDGNHLACRCFFAVDELKTSYGKHVNMIYGFVGFLKSFVKRFGSENHFFVTWDSVGKTWRHKLYPDYKADRKKFPDEFYEQLDDVRQILRVLGICQYKENGVEADDIIGTLAYKSRQNRKRVLIVSSDHDFEQLISNSIQILSPSLAQSKEKFKDKNYVISKYGVKPKQLIDVMALTGDGSDNIAGIPGVGEKTAVNLLKANEGLKNVMDNVDNLKFFNKKGVLGNASESLKGKVRGGLGGIPLTKKLVTINCELPFEPVFERQRFNLGKLIVHFRKLEFKRFLKNSNSWETVFNGRR